MHITVLGRVTCQILPYSTTLQLARLLLAPCQLPKTLSISLTILLSTVYSKTSLSKILILFSRFQRLRISHKLAPIFNQAAAYIYRSYNYSRLRSANRFHRIYSSAKPSQISTKAYQDGQYN